ncbi:M23 family metallopeptidase [Zhenpiania hominis]|uniref:M23 family metallopeptidase n=1 Tax=Zhenpiania hominis TaxID=2763644 RepID=A0A923NGV6_9FIRM|nr:M23 family metallopeptidase [Zhenpiania hominis]MBC6678766.1 M23 family metallopeptidase [Zhenpiania hominis]
MREQKKKKDRAALALVLCFCVVALTSVFAVKSSLNKINAERTNMETAQTTENTENTEDREAAVRTPVVDSKDKNTDTENNSSSSEGTPDYAPPLDGRIQMEYSMDMPIYSKTLDQYMTHPGVDLAAPLSTKVKAIAEGTVTKVSEDDRYGMTVEINHGNGIISTYSNLAEQGLAEMGDVVQQGQIIGAVGETALFEIMEESHLHLEMTKDSAYVNPVDYIKGL